MNGNLLNLSIGYQNMNGEIWDTIGAVYTEGKSNIVIENNSIQSKFWGINANNGSGDYVLIPYDNSFNVNNLTIEAWVYSGNFNQNGFIFEKGPINSQYALFFEGLNLTFRTQHSGNSQNNFVINSSDIGFTSNTWHHLAASYDGTTKKIFVDGSLVASTACTGALLSNTTGSIIGAYNTGFPHY